ncbi:cobalamin biosynthesis protein CbiX [Gordonia spumicola]|uniref:Cobalamin biosynthesis protein CbiX n=1 Tax=Gordonia spumicola TaxID=589161 RepID=A0A7I9VAC5_9ACTN|nr:CbiX/SirB N-terminal domain-containing protein [Gordonia spumicola]GEE02336.1 cobalamin biosynthesis protein CbiX [Gordonia spumicola]
MAHGTRNPHGVALIGDLARAMRERLDVDVSVAFVDVLGPSPSEALARRSAPRAVPERGRGAQSRGVTVVPAFLGRGYHVRRDIPDHLSRPGLPPTTVTDSLGPSDEVLAALVDRLDEAGRRRGDTVVLAAAGSSDPMAVADVEEVADRLSSLVDAPVTVAFAAPSPRVAHIPSVAEAVSRTRGRVAVASHLLAPGLFQSRLVESGADVVARPLGLHPLIVDRACALAARPVTV